MPNTTLESNLQSQAEEFRSGAEKFKKQASEAGDKIRSKAEDAWDDVSELVKKHPAKALGIAIVAGVAFGSLAAGLSRRRSNSAGDKLRDLAGSGVDAWGRVREGFNDAICTMRDAVDEAVEKLK